MAEYCCSMPKEHFEKHGCSYVRDVIRKDGSVVKNVCGSYCANMKMAYIIHLESLINTVSRMVSDWNDSVGKDEHEKRDALQSLLRDKFCEVRRQFFAK